MEDFSVRLAMAIARSGKFKGDLASHCGVALSTVSRWLKGARPKPAAIAQIAEFLGVDPLWLVGESNTVNSASLALDALIYTAGIEMRKDALVREDARLRKALALETMGDFMDRMIGLNEKSRAFMSKCRSLCRAIEDLSPEDPLPVEVKSMASELSALWPGMVDTVHDLLSEAPLLRSLAESSPDLMRILRSE